MFKKIDDNMRLSPKNWNLYMYIKKEIDGNSRTEKIQCDKRN